MILVYIPNVSAKQGSLTYGEYFFKGKSDEEVLLSCYICHPSLCNDSLSGIVTAVQLAKFIENLKQKTKLFIQNFIYP